MVTETHWVAECKIGIIKTVKNVKETVFILVRRLLMHYAIRML
jgi:hypothetical protein